MNSHKRNLMSWFTGRSFGLTVPARGAATIVLEDAADLPALVEGGWTHPESVVYVPDDVVVSGGAGHVVPYRGSFVETGSETQLGDDFFLQVHAYGIAGFLALLGPTAVRVADDEDVEAFVADADAALDGGAWSDVFTNPGVQLADAGAIGGHAPEDGPSLRLYVGRDRLVRVSPTGGVLGTVDDGWPDFIGLGLEPTRLPGSRSSVAAVRDRPWLGRYHSALRAAQSVRARGHDRVEVSGFGIRFSGGLTTGAGEPDLRSPLAPVLLRSGELYFVYVPSTAAMLRARPDTARTLEKALALPDEDGAGLQEALALIERCAGSADPVGA